MATNESLSTSERVITYLKRARWLRAFIVVELFFFGGGWLVAQMGSYEARAISEEVDPHLSLGGLMGAMGIVFAFITLVFVIVSIGFRVRRRMRGVGEY
jgi:hypothetical protein